MINHIARTQADPIKIFSCGDVALDEDRGVVEGWDAEVEKYNLLAALFQVLREVPPGETGAPCNNVPHIPKLSA